MKKTLYFIFAICTLAIVSCTNDFEQEINDGKFSFSSVSASMGDLPTTRTHLENGGRVVWDINDQIGIISDTQEDPTLFTCTSVDDGKALFNSDKEVSGKSYLAYYPYDGSEVEGNTMTYTLSGNTKYMANTYFRQCPMIAKSATNDFAFKHTCGIIRFSIRGTQQISSLVLQGNNNEIIAGTGIIDLNTEIPTLSISSNAKDASKSITMNTDYLCLSDIPTDFYFIVPETEFSQGLSLTINYLNDDSSVTPIKKATTKSVTISRSVIKSFNAIDTDALLQEQEEERIYAALMSFYNATGGDNWTNNENWGSDKPFSEWYGVNYDGQNINALNLLNNNLVGAVENELIALTELENIDFRNNKLTALNISGNTKLKFITCNDNNISSINLSNNLELENLICHNNQLTSLDFTNNPLMKDIWAYNNKISTLNISNCKKIEQLLVSDNLIESIDLNSDAITTLQIGNNKLFGSLDLSNQKELQYFSCYGNNLTSIEISNNSKLVELSCFKNNLSQLNISSCLNLKSLLCNFNELTSLDISKNTELEVLWCHQNNLSELDVTNLKNLQNLWCGNFNSTVGNHLTTLDLSSNVELKEFSCYGMRLTSLDVSYCPNLEVLECSCNPITSLAIGINNNLKEIYMHTTSLTSIDVSNFPNLELLECGVNNITNLDVTKNLSLKSLWCSETQLSTLDVSSNLTLEELVTLNSPNLSTIYIAPEQTFTYLIVDNWTSLKYKGGDHELYESTDFLSDGKVTTLQTASVGYGIDIVLMGDGYSDRLITDGTYDEVMHTAMEKFFSEEPYKSYRNMFNVYSVTAVSKNEAYANGSQTAFSGFFGDGTHVGGNDQKVFEYALKAINEEQMDEALIVVMMNSINYAGTCYMYHHEDTNNYGNGASISYFPVGIDDTALAEVLHHEAGGHGFAKLADEYAYAEYGTVPTDYVTEIQTQQSSWGWWKNVDFTNDLNTIRWSYFIDDNRYTNDGLGAYEGGLTYWRGVWRPTENSIMRHNTGGFNAPSREAIYYRIHKLAYGDSWEYGYEDFVEYDAKNRQSSSTRTSNYVERPKDYKPLHAPITIKGSWKNAKNNSPKKKVSNNSNLYKAPAKVSKPKAIPTITKANYYRTPDGKLQYEIKTEHLKE